MTNPLLNFKDLPPFSEIKPEHVEPAVDDVLQTNREKLDKLLSENKNYSWENLSKPLEEMDDYLDIVWSPVRHMHSVANNEKMRDIYQNCIAKISAYYTELGQSTPLFSAVKFITENKDYDELDAAQKKVLRNQLRDFRLAGVDLPDKQKKEFAELQKELSKLSTKFEENVLDATQGWSRHVADENELAGLPDFAIAAAKQKAKHKQMEGWLLTLDLPTYISVMTHADNAELRKEIYSAYVTRASDQGPNAGKWDNHSTMLEILETRKRIAKLLGFANFSELSLTTKMAESPQKVLTFLEELASAAYPQAKEEFQQLCDFAKTEYGADTLASWDIHYYSEKLRKRDYDISDEDLRPYFPIDKVLTGMFEIVQRLFGVNIEENKNFDKWHEDVRFFNIADNNKKLIGQFYVDLFARENKRGGAWMDECRTRRSLNNGSIQTPVAFLTTNFNPPINSNPALLSHYDVITLFHEFGHTLHHLLTKINYSEVAGLNGVPWDAVELPSQFLENWCWEKEALNLISEHHQSKEKIPDELFNKLHKSKDFQSAMQMVRQLEFALFDFKLHMQFDLTIKNQVQSILDEVRRAISVIPVPNFNCFQNSFSHVFGGGYAAGYYSYKWAEILASDAYSKFEETGIFNAKTGKEFLNTFLESGGAIEPMDLFIKFRGREPTIDALLRHNGIRGKQ